MTASRQRLQIQEIFQPLNLTLIVSNGGATVACAHEGDRHRSARISRETPKGLAKSPKNQRLL
jgi:hypothetical protein